MPLKRAKRSKSKRHKPRGKKGITWSSIRKANKKRKVSSLELLVYSWLTEDNIPFKKEKAIGRCHVDIFLEPDIAIEINGCYFHACKKCFPESSKRQLLIQRKDKNRLKFLRSQGYKVLEVWEHEMTENPDVVRDLFRILGSKVK